MQTKRTTYYRFPASQIKKLEYNDGSDETIVVLKGRQWGEKEVVETEVLAKPKDSPVRNSDATSNKRWVPLYAVGDQVKTKDYGIHKVTAVEENLKGYRLDELQYLFKEYDLLLAE